MHTLIFWKYPVLRFRGKIIRFMINFAFNSIIKSAFWLLKMSITYLKLVSSLFLAVHMDKSFYIYRYMKLVRDTDGPEYNKMNFIDSRTQRFQLMFIMKNPFPSDKLLEKTYVIRVHIPAKDF